MIKDVELAKMLLLRIHYGGFPKEKIYAPGCWIKDWETVLKFDRWNTIVWRFCGSFLLGSKQLFASAFAKQTMYVKKYLPLLTWEVNYWTFMDDDFIWCFCDHDESMLYSVSQHIAIDTF